MEWMENDIRTNWFKDHVADFKIYTCQEAKDFIEFLRWGKPNSSINCIYYMLRNGALSVYGDLGEAVYQWHPSIGRLASIANCELDYFASKCQASEYGRGYKNWNDAVAREYVDDYIQDRVKDDDRGILTVEGLKDSFRLIGGYHALVGTYEWQEWLQEHGYKFFGEDYYEYGNIGMDISTRCRSHLIGLKMAHEQLQQKEVGSNA